MKSKMKTDKRTLLLIDDEPNIIEIVFAILKKPNLRLILAHSGQEALEVLRRQPVDAILSDIRMPQMNGVALVKEVRALGVPTPIVLMSGFAEYSEVLAALRAGVIDIVEKPFSKDRLVQAVEHAVTLGSNVRRVHGDLKNFCESRQIEASSDDVLTYLSIYLSQQEPGRERTGA
jgi:DNA-binding NtrC family response regulator